MNGSNETMVYFRRPQTAFVDSEISQKPQAQWKLVAEGKEASDDDNNNNSNDMNTSSGGLDGSDGGLDGSGSGGSRNRLNENGSSSLLEEEPADGDGDNDDQSTTQDPLASSTEKPTTSTSASSSSELQQSNTEDQELAQSLERRLQLEVKNHPESVLLCGYFHEEVMEDCLTLSTYLPGVEARELRVYYGEGVLKIAGARALYNLVQRFERSFALDEQLVDTNLIAAILHQGMLLVRAPLNPMPPPPRKIKVSEATPMILLFQDRKDMFSLDINVPGVKRKDLAVYYSNGLLRLIWERLEPTNDTTTATTGAALSTSQLKQMRFEKEIPINTIPIDTEKLAAYLDHPSKSMGVLKIVAPIKLKRSARPIEVQTAKELQEIESGTK